MPDDGPVTAGAPPSAVVITVSDSVSAGTREDGSGTVLQERLVELGFEVERALVPDEPERIGRLVAEAADRGARLVVTTGGTGLSQRDRTPEGVGPVIDYVVPGLGEVMRAVGRGHTPLASLSRSLAAVRGGTLILCLPGSPRGALESLDAIGDILGHALEALAGEARHDASHHGEGA
jgi:molybdenum cofactor synthesis domain-containing protein